MTEAQAARLLHDQFYYWCFSDARPGECLPMIRANGHLTVPRPGLQFEMDARRAELLPADFRFTWPYLPHGAHYVVD